jgi:hypothetical protein
LASVFADLFAGRADQFVREFGFGVSAPEAPFP